MQVTKITDGSNVNTISKRGPLTSDEFQSELDYWRTVKILRKMLKGGLISQDEFDKINKLNRQIFSPLYAQLMP